MFIKDLSRPQYNSFYRELRLKARSEPLDAGCAVDMTVNGVEYILKLQPGPNNRVAVLQALRINRGEQAAGHELIVNNSLLSALLEILLHQGLR